MKKVYLITVPSDDGRSIKFRTVVSSLDCKFVETLDRFSVEVFVLDLDDDKLFNDGV